MEGKIASQEPRGATTGTPAKGTRIRPAHLMCGTPLWGFAGAAASAYFFYFSYTHLSNGDYYGVRSWWTVLTYAVWIILITGLLTETRCWRERAFFGLVLIIFLISFASSAWPGALGHAVRQLRIASTALWAVAGVVSLTTARARPPQPRSGGT